MSAGGRFEALDCPVCDGADFLPLFEKRGERFVRCHGCGLVLINPRPRFAAVAATYDAVYSGAYIRKADKKRARCRRWVRRLVRRYGVAGRWLDVGCSAGFVVQAAEEAGFEGHGVELEPAAVAFARETLQLARVNCGLLEGVGYPAGHFDVVSMYDVIEHVPDLNATVAELARILAPDGIIEIRTPDVGHWRTPRALERWPEVKPSEHLYYFDRRTLPRLFARHGLALRERRPMLKPALDMVFGHAR